MKNQHNQVDTTNKKQATAVGYSEAQNIVIGARVATSAGKALAVNDIIKTKDLDGIEMFIQMVPGLTVDQISELAEALMDIAYETGDNRIQTRLSGLVQHAMGRLNDRALNKLLKHIKEEDMGKQVINNCAHMYIRSFDVGAMLQFAEAFGEELNKTSLFEKLQQSILAQASESQANRFYAIKSKLANTNTNNEKDEETPDQ